jgi:hypothetical protein
MIICKGLDVLRGKLMTLIISTLQRCNIRQVRCEKMYKRSCFFILRSCFLNIRNHKVFVFATF